MHRAVRGPGGCGGGRGIPVWRAVRGGGGGGRGGGEGGSFLSNIQ